MSERTVLVTGAGGKLGRLLKLLWPSSGAQGLVPHFLTRAEWDILGAPVPDLPRFDLVLDLAGVIRGDVSQNPLIAERVAKVAAQRGVPLIYMSSAAVYPGGDAIMLEDSPTAPGSDYGRSKCAAEARVREICASALILRLGNVAGADALLGGLRPGVPVVLDPIPGQRAGPVRSYIGPVTLARCLVELAALAVQQRADFPVVNLAQPSAVGMGDLLDAWGAAWQFGPDRPGVLPRMELGTERLCSLLAIEPAKPQGLVNELRAVEGWK